MAHDESVMDGSIGAEGEWTGLLRSLRDLRGLDLHRYKASTLMRRVRRRMAILGVESFAGYRAYLGANPDEFSTLCDAILINVTAFFRDPAAWDVVRSRVLPDILQGRRDTDPIRIWSAGCASGEEAFTIAMLAAEALGPEQFRTRVRIYATDIDEEALHAARRATYSSNQVEGVPPELLARYFDEVDGGYVFRHEVRRRVVFGRHDLIGDAPISRMDLLICRNTLMYFTGETQARVLTRLNFALNDGGYLFLGRAETLMAPGLPLEPVDAERRISRKVRRGSRAGPLSVPRTPASALDASPVAQIVVGPAGELAYANNRARILFDLHDSDLGMPVTELQLSSRLPELPMLERSRIERRRLAGTDVEWRVHGGERRWLHVQLAPLTDARGGAGGAVVAFTDVTAYRGADRELDWNEEGARPPG